MRSIGYGGGAAAAAQVNRATGLRIGVFQKPNLLKRINQFA
jgi:hypothetical protein